MRHPEISRLHAKLSFDLNNFSIEELGSTHGTLIQLRKPKEIINAINLRVGDALLQFTIKKTNQQSKPIQLSENIQPE